MQSHTPVIQLNDIRYMVTSALALQATVAVPPRTPITFSLIEIDQNGTREIPGVAVPVAGADDQRQTLRCVAATSPDAVVCHAVFRVQGHAPWVQQLPEAVTLQPPAPLIRELIQDLPESMLSLVRRIEEDAGEAISVIWGSGDLPEDALFDRVFGSQCPTPRISVVIPYHGRHDFARHQLAAFAEDPCFTEGRAEVVLVLDQPEALEQMLAVTGGLETACGVPFRLAVPTTNLGYAGANNFGVRRARGEFVCLLNSDVLPAGPGWLEKLAEKYVQTEDAGVIGCLLLYENETIQHAGMTFSPLPGTSWHINDHPLKGLGTTFLTESGLRQVPAVTGACMLLRRSEYLEVGGFDPAFLRGDFEDSDLCLRLRQRGKGVYVDLDTVLYHLERQSIAPGPERMKYTLYNAWLQNRRWARELAHYSQLYANYPNMEG